MDLEKEAVEYVAETLRDRIAQDPRVGQLEIQVEVADHRVILNGSVPTPERKEAISEIARREVPGCEVQNDVVVEVPGEPGGPEVIG